MNARLIVLIGAVAVLALALPATAEEVKMEKDEACALLGNCGADMVKAAESMLEECKAMMTKAEELMAKGKTIRGQGLRWGDKEMEADGNALYEQGKRMYDEAKAMSETCKLIIESGDKMKKKYAKAPQRESVPAKKPGDFN